MCEALMVDGALTLIDAGGRTHRFGRASLPVEVVVRLHDRSLHWRLPLRPMLALGEAYMEGSLTVERGSIYDLLDLCARNVSRVSGRRAVRLVEAVGRRLQRRPGARAPHSLACHDDLPDDLYDAFLDWDRQCSCAYFSDPRMTLDEAQQAKKHHIASKLLLRADQKVLDLASGWGGLALHLADAEHVEVTGVTRSVQQLAVSRRRASEAELDGRVSFHVCDFRQEAGRYDRVVSVGMLEHLGTRHYDELFAKVRALLVDDGVAVIHFIGRMSEPSSTSAWLRKYIFPDLYVPALSEVLPAVERAGLWLTDVEILRLHFAETLRHWRRRFVSHWERVATHYDQRFCRMWEYSLAAAEAGFRRGGLTVYELQLARRVDAVPLTRDYLYEPADALSQRVGRPSPR